ncbi:hypothetical protein ACVWXO_005789 [Bradyrhizobium sp. LM2.7]
MQKLNDLSRSTPPHSQSLPASFDETQTDVLAYMTFPAHKLTGLMVTAFG